MSRQNYGRYKPSKWSYSTREEWMTPQEHWALRSEFLLMAFLAAVMFLATFAEPIMDWLEALL